MPPEPLEPRKQAEIDSRVDLLEDVRAHRAPFTELDPVYCFTRWATLAHALNDLGVERGASVLDLACGTGWTTVFLAESGFAATGLDIAPTNLEAGRLRAERWSVDAEFVQGDMESFDLGRSFGAAVVFNSLHHAERQSHVLKLLHDHLEPGGWLLIAEPSLLHVVSPDARRATREEGWTERGVSVRRLKQELRQAGFSTTRRYFEGTHPYASRARGFLWQLARLTGANFAVSPQALVWVAARRAPGQN